MTARSDDAFIPGTSIPLPSTQANDTAATMESKSSPLSKRVAAPCIEAAESEAAAAKDGTPSPPKKRKTATSDGRAGPGGASASGRAELDAYMAKLAGPAGARAEEMAGNRRERVRRASQDLEKLCIKTLGETTELQDAFRAWDLDHSGYIDRGELTLALKRAGRDASEEVVTRQMKELDTDGDGLISFEEFKKISWACLRDRPKSNPMQRPPDDPVAEAAQLMATNQSQATRAAADVPEV